MLNATKRSKASRREISAASNIPYSHHVTPSIVVTDNGDYVCVLRLSGASVECASDDRINNQHEKINRIMMSLADPRITTWQHIVRDEDNSYPGGTFPPGFASDLNDKYRAALDDEMLMNNGLYLSVVYRAQPSMIGNSLMRLVTTMDRQAIAIEREESIRHINEIATELAAGLKHYDAEILSTYVHRGVLFSAPAEFFAFLVNGEWQRIPLAACPLKDLIATARPLFGAESIEMRGPTKSIFSAMLGINAYPAKTGPLFLDELLSFPGRLVITQSFNFQRRDTTLGVMKRTGNRAANAGDASITQQEQLPDAADDIVSRLMVMGEQHYSVEVKADSLDALRDIIALLRPILTLNGILTAREDLVSEAAKWAQLPGNFKHRPRVSLIDSRNVCGFMPLHNFPLGRIDGNHWGEAITTLITAAGGRYRLSLHASDPEALDGGTKRDVAHTLVLGPTGSGKTAAIMLLLSMLQKFGITSVLFSVRRDTQIAIQALGGVFYPILRGQRTGWNPLQLSLLEPGTLPHLRQLVCKLVSTPRMTEGGLEIDATPLSSDEQKVLLDALDSVLRLDHAERRLGRILDFLAKGANSVYERLHVWCYAREPGRVDGIHAWVFDNPADTLAGTLGSCLTTGFDITEFLDDPVLRTPINLYLFYLTSRLIDGRRLGVFFSEFWKSLGDPQFAEFIKELMKTLRARNGFVVLDSQSPSDALSHPLSRTLTGQASTIIMFPDPDASEKELCGGLGFSEREYNLVKTEIPEGQGQFLFKQGRHSLVLKLPLQGFEELAVLSSRPKNRALMEQLIAQYGAQPDLWLPHFYQQRGTE